MNHNWLRYALWIIIWNSLKHYCEFHIYIYIILYYVLYIIYYILYIIYYILYTIYCILYYIYIYIIYIYVYIRDHFLIFLEKLHSSSLPLWGIDVSLPKRMIPLLATETCGQLPMNPTRAPKCCTNWQDLSKPETNHRSYYHVATTGLGRSKQ